MLIVGALVAGYFFLALPAVIRYLVRENDTVKLDRIIATHGTLSIPSLISCLGTTGNFYVNPVPGRLAKFGPAVFKPLLFELDSPSRGPHAAEVFALIGAAAVEPLFRKMESGSAEGQENAQKALGTGMICSPKGMLPFLALVNSVPENRRERYYKLITPPCARGGEPDDVPRLIPLIGDDNLDIKYWALNILGGLGADGEGAVEALRARIEVGGSERWIYMTTFMRIRGTGSYPDLYPYLPGPTDVFLTNQILTTLGQLAGAPGPYCRYLRSLTSPAEDFQKLILPQIRALIPKCPVQ